MMEFLIFVAVLLSVPALVLGLIQLMAPQSSVHEGVRRRLTQFKLWQLLVAVILCGLLFSMTTVNYPGVPFTLALLIVLCLYLRTWRDEFIYLMGLRDEDFPGRNDKLVWILVLLLIAPLGAWLFRSFRLAHWPEPERRADPAAGGAEGMVPSS